MQRKTKGLRAAKERKQDSLTIRFWDSKIPKLETLIFTVGLFLFFVSFLSANLISFVVIRDGL